MSNTYTLGKLWNAMKSLDAVREVWLYVAVKVQLLLYHVYGITGPICDIGDVCV